MYTRPIVLGGGEVCPPSLEPVGHGLHFDGRTGLWRDASNRLAIHSLSAATTQSTRTREGVDQSEGVTSTTRITKTMEGTDQVETGR